MSAWSPLDLLPGCYFAVLALAVAAVLGRWFDPLPKRVLAAAGLVIGVLFGGALGGGGALLPLDNLRGEVPFRGLAAADPPGNPIQGDLVELVTPSLDAVRRGLLAGRWPLWNARAGAGMPLLADPQAQALSPVALAALPLSPVRGAAVLAALRVYLALVFTFLLLRRQGLGLGPALAGGLAFGLSGFVVLWVGWPLASAAALLPAVLYALARVIDPAAEGGSGGGVRRRDGALLGAALAALLLAGHPETILYAGLLAAAFAAERIWRCPAGTRRRAVRAVAAAALLAGGVAAPALLPALDYLPQTLRAARLAQPAAAKAMAAPWSAAELASEVTVSATAASQARVAAGAAGTGGGGPAVQPATGGTAGAPIGGPAAAAGTGAGEGEALARRWLQIVAPNAYGNSRFAGYWGAANSNEDASGFAGTAMVLAAALALVAGGAGARRLPGELVILAAAAVCLVVLADPAPVHAAVAAVAPALAGSGRCRMVVAFCVAYLGACTLERHRRGEVDRLAVVALAAALAAILAWGYLAHPFPGDAGRLAILRFGWLRWQARFLVLATLLLAIPAGRAYAGVRRLATGVLAVAVAAELLLAHGPANPAMPLQLALARPAPLAALIAAAGPGSGERIAGLGTALPANLGALYGLTDARVYNPMAPAAYLGLLAPVIGGWRGEAPVLGAPGDPLYRRLGVRYLLVAPDAPPLPAPWRLAAADPAGWIYRQPHAWPRLYAAGGPAGEPLPGGLAVMLFEDQAIAALRPPAGPGREVAGSVEHAGSLYLAASLYQDGGWRLLLDRRPAATPPAGRLLAAPLPPATRRVDLIYRPRGFLAGLLAAALALAGAALAWLPVPCRAG